MMNKIGSDPKSQTAHTFSKKQAAALAAAVFPEPESPAPEPDPAADPAPEPVKEYYELMLENERLKLETISVKSQSANIRAGGVRIGELMDENAVLEKTNNELFALVADLQTQAEQNKVDLEAANWNLSTSNDLISYYEKQVDEVNSQLLFERERNETAAAAPDPKYAQQIEVLKSTVEGLTELLKFIRAEYIALEAVALTYRRELGTRVASTNPIFVQALRELKESNPGLFNTTFSRTSSGAGVEEQIDALVRAEKDHNEMVAFIYEMKKNDGNPNT